MGEKYRSQSLTAVNNVGMKQWWKHCKTMQITNK